jgi:hypothetical protein
MPAGVRRRKVATAHRHSGAASSASRWSAENTNGEISKVQAKGRSTAPVVISMGLRPHRKGRPSAATDSSWARPMVATVSTSRGARWKRRMASRSISAPSATAAVSPAAKATGKGTPSNRNRALASTAGTTPSWPWAKLTMRLAR